MGEPLRRNFVKWCEWEGGAESVRLRRWSAAAAFLAPALPMVGWIVLLIGYTLCAERKNQK